MNNTITQELDTIIQDTLTRQPTKKELNRYFYCITELITQDKKKQYHYYYNNLKLLVSRVERDGYANPRTIKPECGA